MHSLRGAIDKTREYIIRMIAFWQCLSRTKFYSMLAINAEFHLLFHLSLSSNSARNEQDNAKRPPMSAPRDPPNRYPNPAERIQNMTAMPLRPKKFICAGTLERLAPQNK